MLFGANRRIRGSITFRRVFVFVDSVIRKYRFGLQLRLKTVDEGLHRRMPKAIETEEIHFVHRLLGCPTIKGHAISGNKYAGAVLAQTAMHKHLFFWVAVKQG